MKKFNWIHFSDFHCGQKFQWSWNNFKKEFYEDIRHICRKIEKVDLVIFSGDLVQSGSEEEYSTLTKELEEIWKIFKEEGSDPYIFHVPGNHDLIRPKEKDAYAKVLTQWQTDLDVAKDFWDEDPDNQYRKTVSTAFKNYMEWSKKLSEIGIKFPPYLEGIIPGDRSALIEIENIKIGIIGLNSSFLHLRDIQKGSLEVNLKQLNAITNDNPPSWFDQNTINILVTHHPPDWFSPFASDQYFTEIFPSGRFIAHFFGHMHNADYKEIRSGGDHGRRFIQAISLFGMEYLTDGKTERLHGYTAGQILFDDNNKRLRFWPRKAEVSEINKDRNINPNHSYKLIKGQEYFEEDFQIQNENSISKKILSPDYNKNNDLLISESKSVILEKALSATRAYLPEANGHIAVRLLNQRTCIDGLKRDRAVWIAADWGLGSDGFIAAILKINGKNNYLIYKISLKNYLNRDAFIAQFSVDVGCSFSQYCNALATTGKAVLILDEAPTSPPDFNGVRIECEIIYLVNMILDFCPELDIFILSRIKPVNIKIYSVLLEPLDELETKSYLESQINIDSNITDRDGVSLIYRRSGGLPGKIDSTLKTLRLLSLAELSDEYSQTGAAISISGEAVPSALKATVDELIESNDSLLKRAYFLLKSLTVLPHGESIERLKRIDPTMPVFSKHAAELLDRGLIQVRSSTVSLSGGRNSFDGIRIIYAPQPVADYVISLLTLREINSLVKKSISLYFGANWREGGTALRKLSGILVSDEGTLVANPHSLVIRLLADETTWTTSKSSAPVFNLCQNYTKALLSGKHYRSAVDACKEIISANNGRYFGPEIIEIEFILARALRMIGEYEPAKIILEKMFKEKSSNDRLAHIGINLAMTLQSMDDPEAIVIARKIVEVAPNGGHGLQAKSIILELETDKSNKQELLKIEKDARSKGFNVVANNMALDRINYGDKKINLNISVLEEVYTTAILDGDKYTAARAIIKIAKISESASRALTELDIKRLKEAYEYLYGERLNAMFDGVHSSLWKYFQKLNDIPNLLSLFRHSSFIWRLRGTEEREEDYATILVSSAKQILTVDILKSDKDTAYFLLRLKNNNP